MINSGSNAIMFNKIRVANYPFFKMCTGWCEIRISFFNLCPRSFIGLSGDFLSKNHHLLLYRHQNYNTTKIYPFSMLPNKECTLILVEKWSHFCLQLWHVCVCPNPIPQPPFFCKNNGTYQLFNLLFFSLSDPYLGILSLYYTWYCKTLYIFFWLILSRRIMDKYFIVFVIFTTL